MGLQVGRGLGNWQGFFSCGWVLDLEKKLLDCGVVWQGEQQKRGLIFALRRGMQDGGVDGDMHSEFIYY